MLHTRDEIRRLCGSLDMPGGMTELIVREVNGFDFFGVAGFVPDLLNPKTAGYATSRISGGLDGYGVRLLVVSLSAAIDAEDIIYKPRGTSRDVYIDTMKCFSRFVREFYETHGVYGYDTAFWSWRQLAGTIYRLGALEFETTRYDGEGKPGLLSHGEPVLSVHIPSDALLSRAELDNSYARARAFFADTEHARAPFYCDSWLLSPALKEMLRPDSNILRFSGDYTIIAGSPHSDGANIRIFKRLYKSASELPEDTSLQRAAKKRLLSGGHVGDGEGVLRA